MPIFITLSFHPSNAHTPPVHKAPQPTGRSTRLTSRSERNCRQTIPTTPRAATSVIRRKSAAIWTAEAEETVYKPVRLPRSPRAVSSAVRRWDRKSRSGLGP